MRLTTLQKLRVVIPKSGPVLAYGMAVFTPEKDCLVTEILNRADKAMYKNKRDLKK